METFALVTRRQPRETHLRNVWSARFTDEESEALDQIIAAERLSSAADVIRLLVLPELARRGLLVHAQSPQPAERPPGRVRETEPAAPRARDKNR